MNDASLPEVMQADQNPPGEIPPRLAVLGVQALVFHGLYGHVFGPDGDTLAEHIPAASGYLVTPEISAPYGQPPFGWYV